MTLHVDREQLATAHSTIRRQLLAERHQGDHWVGELSSSPLATATAISALILAERHVDDSPADGSREEMGWLSGLLIRNELNELVIHSLQWLAQRQNDDGGWGDSDRSGSNLQATLLVQAAFHLTGVPAKYADLLERSKEYVKRQGGISAVKKNLAHNRIFAASVLGNCALAEMLPWKKVPTLPFELACLPQHWYQQLRMRVGVFAIPAEVAIGQAKFFHAPPRNPLMKWIRRLACRPTLAKLESMQPGGGGFLETVPLTSFAVMSLASMGMTEHMVVRRGVEFLLATVRPDGSWPVVTNIATWNTVQAATALDWHLLTDEEGSDGHADLLNPSEPAEETLHWLLDSQHRQQPILTGASAGGWSWTDLSGGVPESIATSGALLALAAWRKQWPRKRTSEVNRAALDGIRWLLDLQNKDGGWPRFCCGGSQMQFDPSSSDATALVIKALAKWKKLLHQSNSVHGLNQRIGDGINQGVTYLEAEQRPDGSWAPHWFGNEFRPDKANLVIGTSRVLQALNELELGDSKAARRGVGWLVQVQYPCGGWGPVQDRKGESSTGKAKKQEECDLETRCTVEETAMALDGLLASPIREEAVEKCVDQGVSWLIEAVRNERHVESAPIGLYYAGLWYHEKLYPYTFALTALAEASRTGTSNSAAVESVR